MKKYLTKFNIITIVIILIMMVLLVISSLLDFKVPVKITLDIEECDELEPLQSNNKIEIIYSSRVDNLTAIEIPTSRIAGDNNRIWPDEGEITIKVYDSKNKTIFKNDLSKMQIFNDKNIYLYFKPIKKSLNKKYKIEITSHELPENYNIYFKLLKKDYDKIISYENGEQIEDIPVSEYGDVETSFYKLLFMGIILILVFILFRHNFSNNKKLKKYLLKNKKVFFIEFIFSILACTSFLYFRFINMVKMYTDYKSALILAISVVILLFIFSLYIFDKDLKKEDLFLLIAIPLSTMYLVFMIPTTIPDSYYHYKIANKVSEFNIFSQTTSVPRELSYYPTGYNELLGISIKVGYKSLNKVSAGEYHPLLYLFAGIGILVAKLLHFGPMLSIYMGVLFNQIVYLISGYFIIKKMPFGKLLTIIYLLMPMYLHQTISISGDSMLNIFSILYIANVLYIHYDKKKIETTDFILLLISLIFILISKNVYFIMLLFLIMIRKELKEYCKKHKKLSIILIIISLILIFGWTIYYKVITFGNPPTYDRVSAKTKILYVLSNPSYILPIVVSTLRLRTNFYLESSLGGALGHLNIIITDLYVYLNLFILIFSIFAENNKYEPKKDFKIISIIVFIIVSCCILGGLYLSWGVVTDTFIEGVQGRYFLPVLILLPLLFVKKNKAFKSKYLEPTLIILFLINNLLVISEIIRYFTYI